MKGPRISLVYKMAAYTWDKVKSFLTAREHRDTVRRYVLFSWLGALIWIAAFILWTSVYQTQRQNWGKSGIYLSFVLPGGVA
uniref:Uncharacterized protein n=1 Tax=Amphimedon queenslandica TaxID=400682 RepID=A0A1X7SKD5_AMPQE